MREPIVVFKRDLPRPLVVTDDEGRCEVLELAPAGKDKLGAYTRAVQEWVRREVLARLRRK